METLLRNAVQIKKVLERTLDLFETANCLKSCGEQSRSLIFARYQLFQVKPLFNVRQIIELGPVSPCERQS